MPKRIYYTNDHSNHFEEGNTTNFDSNYRDCLI